MKRRRSRRRQQRLSEADGSINRNSVLKLVERQEFRCALTGKLLTPQTASLDHIVPVCRGGEHRIENTQILERTVNRAKGTLTNPEFIALCCDVWQHVNRQMQSPASNAAHQES